MNGQCYIYYFNFLTVEAKFKNRKVNVTFPFWLFSHLNLNFKKNGKKETLLDV